MTSSQLGLQRLTEITTQMINSIVTDHQEGRHKPGVRYIAAQCILRYPVSVELLNKLCDRLVEHYRDNPLTDRLMVAYHQGRKLLMVVVEMRHDHTATPSFTRRRRTRLK